MKIKAGDIVVVDEKKVSGVGSTMKINHIYVPMKVVAVVNGMVEGWWNFERMVGGVMEKQIVYVAKDRADVERYIEEAERRCAK